jgi:hypothetical protein
VRYEEGGEGFVEGMSRTQIESARGFVRSYW